MSKAKLRFLIFVSVLFLGQTRIAWAFDNTPPVTTHSLSGTLGANSWYTTSVDVDLVAVDNDGQVASTEYWVDDGTHNTITYLPGGPTQVEFNVSSDGNHTISYFSTNSDGVQEAVKTTPSFKIDTSAPANWRNFTATQLNDHTFALSITVDDLPSGLDVSTAYYNYSVDGVNYGYYTNPSACNSGFVSQDASKNPDEAGSGWRPVPTVSPNLDGSITVTMTTEYVDFCNSNWNLSEAVQFYIKDMAGNESYKLQLLFGPWISITGDFHSQGAVNFSTQGNVDYLVSSKISPINNMISAKGWYTAPYDIPLSNMSYAYWYSRLGSPTTGLPSGDLPSVKGVFRVNNDFTIDSNTLPAGLSTAQNFGAVVFINGSLTINTNFSLHPSSGIVFIVRDNLRTSRTVDAVSGFYIVDDNVDFSYNGNNNHQLVLTGGVVGSGTWRFGKNIGGTGNVGTAAERFIQNPGYLANRDLTGYLSTAASYQWTEVAP